MNENTFRKFKFSKQRELILNILRSTKTHPTADWIYEKARGKIDNISLGTVYRNLNFLKEEGRIRELYSRDGSKRYDADLRNHHHISCVKCGKIEDVPDSQTCVACNDVESLTCYQIFGYNLEYKGLCSDCQNKESCHN